MFALVWWPSVQSREAVHWDWSDDQGELSQYPEYAATKKLCQELTTMEPPAEDLPRAADRAALAVGEGETCDSEALYYGIGTSPKPELARVCAFIEREQESAYGTPFSGTVMLMTIYANGIGAKRNLDLATHYACQLHSAPAEFNLRTAHLQALKTKANTQATKFHFCDDVTSGFAMGSCSVHGSRFQTADRQNRIDVLTSGWDADRLAAFWTLRKAEETYATASALDEVDQSGSMRAVFTIEREQSVHDGFIALLERVARGGTAGNLRDFRSANALLNKRYRQLMKQGEPEWGTISIEGIQTTQQAWIAYRDGWSAFAAQMVPKAKPDDIKAALTEERAKFLAQLLSQQW